MHHPAGPRGPVRAGPPPGYLPRAAAFPQSLPVAATASIFPAATPAFPPPTQVNSLYVVEPVLYGHFIGDRLSNGSYTLTETHSGTDSDSDSKLDGYIELCRTFHIAQTLTWIPTPCFCVGLESGSESVPESVSDNVNEPLSYLRVDQSH